MLIDSQRHRPEDLARWQQLEQQDAVVCQLRSHQGRVARARDELTRFVESHPRCYAGVSWGKDSTVLAHLMTELAPSIPLIWVRVEPIANPDCVLVRDVFLSSYPNALYKEIEERCSLDEHGWHATGTLERGFNRVRQRYSDGHISGIRADESGQRKLRGMRYGASSKRTCAPMIWWKGSDVFAYLYQHQLPVHPAYACLRNGLLDRDRIRVASLDGQRGRGWGRHEWERIYYGDVLSSMRRQGDNMRIS